MRRCGPQEVGIPYDCSATGLLGLEVHVLAQQNRIEPFRTSQNERPCGSLKV